MTDRNKQYNFFIFLRIIMLTPNISNVQTLLYKKFLISKKNSQNPEAKTKEAKTKTKKHVCIG